MDIGRYDNIKTSPDFKTYSFISKGPKGDLVKIVQFAPFPEIPGTHNLSLGTIRGNGVDYTETTDNGDRNQILATIFHIAVTYSRVYPNRKIFIKGRNQATTRLYRGAINHSYKDIQLEFAVLGGTYLGNDGTYEFEHFAPNKRYDAFLFERR